MSTKELFEKAPVREPFEIKAISAAALMSKEIAAQRMVVSGFVVEGLNLWAGKPKSGKSWLILHLALSVATGGLFLGAVQTAQSEVLLCALEDSESRLQARLEQLLGEGEAPPGLHLALELPRLNDGGVKAIEDWLKQHPKAALVVIDTLARVKPRASRNASMYDADTDALAPLQKLAMEHGVAVIVVHHTRKAAAEDVFDTLSGSLGLTGVADALAVLQRKRDSKEGTFSLTGRDVEEETFTLNFDPSSGRWALSDPASSRLNTLSPERKQILDALTKHGPLHPIEIAKTLGQSDSSGVRKLLLKMRKSGNVERLEGGKYRASSVPAVPTPSSEPVTEDLPSGTKETANVPAVPAVVEQQPADMPGTVGTAGTAGDKGVLSDINAVIAAVPAPAHTGNAKSVRWHRDDPD